MKRSSWLPTMRIAAENFGETIRRGRAIATRSAVEPILKRTDYLSSIDAADLDALALPKKRHWPIFN